MGIKSANQPTILTSLSYNTLLANKYTKGGAIMITKAKIVKIIKIAIPVCILFVILLAAGILWFKAGVSVRDYDENSPDAAKRKFTESVHPSYELGYNSYGILILKYPGKAMKQFKKDYAVGLEYMTKVRGLPEFSDDYEVLQKYAIQCWQITGNIQESIDNKEEVNSQLNAISTFAYLYWNGKWQNYAPFYGALS